MLKRFFLITLLAAPLAAVPPSAFEQECRRLEPLLEEYEPGCPDRLARLREQAARLAPGADRAHFYWLSARFADRSDDSAARDQFQRLALAEPGVAPLTRALWLHHIDHTQWSGHDAVRDAWVLDELSKLAEQNPQARIFWCSQMAQASAAEARGQTTLARTLWLSALSLAEKERWSEQQVEVWLRMHRMLEDGDRNWEGALRAARASKRSDLLWQVLKVCRTRSQWDRALAAFPAAPDGLKVKRCYADLFSQDEPREMLLNADQRVGLWSDLATQFHKLRDFEQEIESRRKLGLNLLRANHIRQGLRQLEATVQLRLDHPLSNPDWAPNSRRLGYLAYELASKQAWTGYSQQSLDTVERSLAQGWTTRLKDQRALAEGAIRAARGLGDEERLTHYWRVNWELAPRFPKLLHGEVYSSLLNSAPSEADKEKVLRAICDWSEEMLQNNPAPAARWTALVHRGTALRHRGQKEAALSLWLAEAARRDPNTIATCSGQIMNLYRDLQRSAELKEYLLSRLADTQCSNEERDQILSEGCYALPPDPEALVMADQLVRLREKRQPGSQEHLYALEGQAWVLAKFQRFETAFKALDQAEALARSHRGLDRWLVNVEERRCQLLWDSGHREDALARLSTLVQKDYAKERPEQAGSVAKVALWHEQLGQDWQADYEGALQLLAQKDEGAQSLIPQVEMLWLLRLAKLERWDEGRQVLQKHPWKASSYDENTRKLQTYPQWVDLLPPPPAARDAKSQSKQPELAAVLDELRLNRPELGQLLSLRSTNLRHLQARLGPHDTLVTYCRSGSDLYLFALQRDSSFYRCTPAPTLETDVKTYLKALNSDARSQAEGALFSLLLQPVLRDDPNQRLFLVPTGELWQLPFGALRDVQNRSAAAGAELVLLGSGDLLRMADKSWEPYRLSQPLAIGAPPDADLPGAYAELEEVSKVLPGCRLSRGAEAVSSVLYEPQQQWGLLHFASHAHYRRDRPTESDIQLHDGPLQLKQLPQLSLAEHSLVALSCCQGGDSKGQALDEPVTLATGFSAAGAETVVANLWRVDDEVARLFFGEFYRELAGGASPGKSFRSAQDQTRRRFPKVSDWAGFFLLGNPT